MSDIRTKTATIVDVAIAADVSKSTVSLVLKGSPLIKEETASRVREVAARLGYVYNRRAGELRGNASNAIGVIVNDLMNPFFAEILVGIERKLVEAGYVVLMSNTNEDVMLQDRVLMSMREQNVAGLMLCPALGTSKGALKVLQSWNIPLTLFVRSLGTGNYDFAGSDSENGLFLSTSHLLKLGHKRVAFLGGRDGQVYNDRLSGYKKALATFGVDFDESLVVRSYPNREGGYASMQTLLKESAKVNAAVCYNDIVALGALSALGESNVKPGRDFRIVGYDNILESAHSNPPLSTIDVQPRLLGERAAAILLQRLKDPKGKRMTYNANGTLTLRQSA